MPEGTVKFFRQDGRFGFIAPDGGGNDVFVHANDLKETGLSSLSAGQKVTFDIELDKRSRILRAVNVRIPE
jgi:cold shock protein